MLQVYQHAPKHMFASPPELDWSVGDDEALPAASDDSYASNTDSQSRQPQWVATDELQEGGWSSGFDDSDDDIIGGTY